MSFLITILAIGFVIFIHELGHLLAAKRANVGVTEFAVGMGPKVISFDWSETTYSLRLLPFGGFIKAKGLDDLDDCPIEEDYRQKSVLSRMSIIVAGSFMNLVLGIIIFSTIGFLVGSPIVTSNISSIMPNFPAENAGVIVGDTIVELNGVRVNDVNNDFISKIKSSNGTPVDITLVRQTGESYAIQIEPIQYQGNYVVGIAFETVYSPMNFFSSISFGISKTANTIAQTFHSLKLLITGQANINELAGPLGIVQLASSQYNQNLTSFFALIAFISISLGVINMFPFPVLDGGHFLFLIIEAIQGKPVNTTVERVLSLAATVCLVGLMIFVVFNDVIQWGDRVEIIQKMRTP